MKGGGRVLILTALSALGQLINFGYRVVMARMVGAEVMGLYQLVMSAYAVIQAVTTNGLSANQLFFFLSIIYHLKRSQRYYFFVTLSFCVFT